jgi:hypothetical protein
MAQLEFDSERSMTVEGTVIHQAMASEDVWRSPWLDGNEEQA